MPSINVKWGKEKLQVDANLEEPPIVLKSQLFAITGVAPDRQKVVVKVHFIYIITNVFNVVIPVETVMMN
uniref:Galectin n=1 Tax=Heterorhabditis bacteriophora TaxID=37862 RepID=A0A1I7WPM4_HETBA